MNSTELDQNDKNSLVTVIDGEAVTNSYVIAEGAGAEHRSVVQLLRNNLSDFEEFGRVRFEIEPFATAGGVQERTIAILNEQHATLLLTFMRNIGVVKEFKKRLVRAFFELKRSTQTFELSGPELMARALIEADSTIKAKDARIAELEPKAAYVDQFVTDEDYMSFRTVASTLNVGEKWLRDFLVERGWIKRETVSRWSEAKGKKVVVNRYSEYAHKKGYFFRREDHDAPRFRGELMHTLKITADGANAIARLIGRAPRQEILPVGGAA